MPPGLVLGPRCRGPFGRGSINFSAARPQASVLLEKGIDLERDGVALSLIAADVPRAGEGLRHPGWIGSAVEDAGRCLRAGSHQDGLILGRQSEPDLDLLDAAGIGGRGRQAEFVMVGRAAGPGWRYGDRCNRRLGVAGDRRIGWRRGDDRPAGRRPDDRQRTSPDPAVSAGAARRRDPPPGRTRRCGRRAPSSGPEAAWRCCGTRCSGRCGNSNSDWRWRRLRRASALE